MLFDYYYYTFDIIPLIGPSHKGPQYDNGTHSHTYISHIMRLLLVLPAKWSFSGKHKSVERQQFGICYVLLIKRSEMNWTGFHG